jgi:trimeric autotransporter adhesin
VPAPAEPMPAPEAQPNPVFAAPGSVSAHTPAAAPTLTPAANAGAIYGSMDQRGYGSVAEAVRVNVNQAEASAVAAVDDAADVAKAAAEKAEVAAESVAAQVRTVGERVVVGGADKVEAAADALDDAAEDLKDAAVETRSAATESTAARAAIAAAATASAATASAGTIIASKPAEAPAKAEIVSKSDDTGPDDGSGSLAELFRKL